MTIRERRRGPHDVELLDEPDRIGDHKGRSGKRVLGSPAERHPRLTACPERKEQNVAVFVLKRLPALAPLGHPHRACLRLPVLAQIRYRVLRIRNPLLGQADVLVRIVGTRYRRAGDVDGDGEASSRARRAGNIGGPGKKGIGVGPVPADGGGTVIVPAFVVHRRTGHGLPARARRGNTGAASRPQHLVLAGQTYRVVVQIDVFPLDKRPGVRVGYGNSRKAPAVHIERAGAVERNVEPFHVRVRRAQIKLVQGAARVLRVYMDFGKQRSPLPRRGRLRPYPHPDDQNRRGDGQKSSKAAIDGILRVKRDFIVIVSG